MEIMNALVDPEKWRDDFLQKRILVLNQEIYSDIFESVVAWIIQWNIEDSCILKKDRQPITLLINSNGGSILAAHMLMDAIKTSETPVRTVGLGLIASSAFYIYLAASERYAFPNSVFLMHEGEIDIENSPSKAKNVMEFFNKVDERIKDYVVDVTTMTPEEYDDNYTRELYMYADEAKEFGIVNKIIGKDVTLNQFLKG